MERRNRKEKKRTEIKLKMMILLSFSHLNEMQHKDNGVKREGKKNTENICYISTTTELTAAKVAAAAAAAAAKNDHQ